MLTLISTLISFLSGGLPKLLDFFQDKSDKKHELELAQMQISREVQLAAAGYAAAAAAGDAALAAWDAAWAAAREKQENRLREILKECGK